MWGWGLFFINVNNKISDGCSESMSMMVEGKVVAGGMVAAIVGDVVDTGET